MMWELDKPSEFPSYCVRRGGQSVVVT